MRFVELPFLRSPILRFVTMAMTLGLQHCSDGSDAPLSSRRGSRGGVSEAGGNEDDPSAAADSNGSGGTTQGPSNPTSNAGRATNNASTTPSAQCSPGPGPASVRTIPVSFEVGEPPATLTGGDPSGTWIVTSGKVYLPNSASFAFDRNASKGELSGWAKFQGKDALVDIRLNATTVVLGQSSPYQETLSGRGPSEVTGNQLRVAWACPQEGGAASGTIGFSVHGDGATLVYKEAAGNLGDIYMVAEATRAP